MTAEEKFYVFLVFVLKRQKWTLVVSKILFFAKLLKTFFFLSGKKYIDYGRLQQVVVELLLFISSSSEQPSQNHNNRRLARQDLPEIL